MDTSHIQFNGEEGEGGGGGRDSDDDHGIRRLGQPTCYAAIHVHAIIYAYNHTFSL